METGIFGFPGQPRKDRGTVTTLIGSGSTGTSGNFQVPDWANWLRVTVCGGGSGGTAGDISANGGTGGPSGCITIRMIRVRPNEIIPYTIGGGGGGSSTGSLAPSAGGDSSFGASLYGSYIVARGGYCRGFLISDTGATNRIMLATIRGTGGYYEAAGTGGTGGPSPLDASIASGGSGGGGGSGGLYGGGGGGGGSSGNGGAGGAGFIIVEAYR